MPDRQRPYRTQALFQTEIKSAEKRELLLECYRKKVAPEEAAVLLSMRRIEVENWYLRLALSTVCSEFQQVLLSGH